jgi:hypothetical protein
MPAQTVIKLRRGTASQWTSANPVLSAGEMGIETDTNRSKYGDGTTAWASLSYTVGDSSGIGTIEWTSVTDKPTEFPPEAHTHVMADITDLDFPPTTVLSDTEPASPVLGTRWINTTNFIEYIYYDSYWVEV